MPIFRANSIEVDNRLEQLGWSREELMEIVDAMVSARNSCTDNDPISAPGWMSWKEGSRRLREIGLPKGLAKSDADQIPWVVDNKRGLRIAVSNTDEGTGQKHPQMPQNCSQKGPATSRVVGANQLNFFDQLDAGRSKVVPLSLAGRQPGVMASWYLCVFGGGDEPRAELSLPVAAEGGYFTDFVERIVLLGPDDGSTPIRRRDDDEGGGEEFDIPVSRK